MGREKRKSRLDKGSAPRGDFVGFSQFAAPTTTLRASPVCTASDTQLGLVFKRITQKRDSVTKTKSLQELQAYFENEGVIRKNQVEALAHLVFVYHSKLAYDDAASVRAAAILCVKAASHRVPKAWNTLVEDLPEVNGMLWCAQADPTQEVRSAATPSFVSTSEGVILYVKRILGYDRPRIMHDALFARKQMDSDAEQDELDERYERIVGTALSGIELWIQRHPETDQDLYEGRIDDAILWKAFNSSKSPLRRKTYALLATLCQHAKSLAYGPIGESTLPKLFTIGLTSEKEAANVPLLLEVLLVYLNHFPESNPWVVLDAQVITKNLGKLLKKACHGASVRSWGPTILPLLAAIEDDTYTLQRKLLTNMWGGREATVGTSDTLLVAAAVAECSAFVLLRRQSETGSMPMEVANDFARIWLKVLALYLSFETVNSFANGSEVSLLQTLSDGYCAFDESCCIRPQAAIYGIRDWFWNDAIVSTVLEAKGSDTEQRLAQLWAKAMEKESRDGMQKSFGNRAVCKCFHATLTKYQGSSDCVPDKQTYHLMVSSLSYCGAQFVFSEIESTTPLEKFLMNDLLRWIVTHASSPWTASLMKFDFTLLRICLRSISSPQKQKSLWESILREIIAVDCDLESLSEGLDALLEVSEESESSIEWKDIIRCETLDNYAIRVGEEAVERHQNYITRDADDDSDDESVHDVEYGNYAKKSALFLQTCVGLTPESSAVLVSQRVVNRWIDIAAPVWREHEFQLGGYLDLADPLITTLLSLVFKGHSMTPVFAERILLECCRLGGNLWDELAFPKLLSQNDSSGKQLHSCHTIIEKGASKLVELLEILCRARDIDHSHVALVCHAWSRQAFRVLHLCLERAKAGADRNPAPSLALVGIGTLDLWSRTSSREEGVSVFPLYLCLVYLLQQFESYSERLELFLQSSDSSSRLSVNVLHALSDASNLHVADPSTRRDQRCSSVLTLLGGRDNIPDDVIQAWCVESIRTLSVDMVESSLPVSARIKCGVSVLSELLSVLFDEVIENEGAGTSSPDIVKASEVQEGDNLWYLADPEDPKKRQRALVVKIHTDVFLRYFTIRVGPDDGAHERQTVVERLRNAPYSDSALRNKGIGSYLPSDEVAKRTRFGHMILSFVKPVLSPFQEDREDYVLEAAAECLQLFISHCGMLGKAGLGSSRYEVFQMLSSLQSNVSRAMLSANGPKESVMSLRVLSLAMGLGNVAAASSHNFKVMKFSPDESVQSILQYYKGSKTIRMNRVDRSVLEWLTIAVCDISDNHMREEAITLLYTLTAALLSQVNRGEEEALADSLLAMRAFGNAQASTAVERERGNPTEALENDVMSEIISAFANDWDHSVDDTAQYQVLGDEKCSSPQRPVWYEPFQHLLISAQDLPSSVVPMAAAQNCEALVANLFSAHKRWFAFRLLEASAGAGRPLHDDLYYGDKTKRRLDSWVEFLVDEEAEELDTDVGLVGQWLPESMMAELESWEDENDTQEELANTIASGRMLCWLCFLAYVDAVASHEVRFRGSVSAYLDKIRAANRILSASLDYLNIDGDRSAKQIIFLSLEDTLDNPAGLDAAKLASLVFFRSVEAFPTHVKLWWEEDCPRALSSGVSQLVETRIAPQALERELGRINNATNLGDMTVSGSIVSREVTATYFQDECKLSIVIQIPPTFPLRNVDVDGRGTLGIPEKRWKRWALQIRLMLNSQDGTLLDALMLWKENVDKDFAGLEPCPVCYSVLSVKTHELPNLECNTCSNVFHSACLYKWFHSSGKSQCVLCQQPWSGTRVHKTAKL